MNYNNLTEEQKSELYSKILKKVKEIYREHIKTDDQKTDNKLTDSEMFAILSIAISYNIISLSFTQNPSFAKDFINKISLAKTPEAVVDDILTILQQESYYCLIDAAIEEIIEQKNLQTIEQDQELDFEL
ncbi:MAG: hypothetical protein ACI4GW_01870 [Lachnospiraceae bacterium]